MLNFVSFYLDHAKLHLATDSELTNVNAFIRSPCFLFSTTQKMKYIKTNCLIRKKRGNTSSYLYILCSAAWVVSSFFPEY